MREANHTIKYLSSLASQLVECMGSVFPYMGYMGCVAQQIIVFASLSPEQGLQISVSLFPIQTLEHHQGFPFLLSCNKFHECCCSSSLGPTACLLKHAISDYQRSTTSHIRQSGTVSMLHHFVLERCCKILFSLERGQVSRHPVAHPHPKLRGVHGEMILKQFL